MLDGTQQIEQFSVCNLSKTTQHSITVVNIIIDRKAWSISRLNNVSTKFGHYSFKHSESLAF